MPNPPEAEKVIRKTLAGSDLLVDDSAWLPDMGSAAESATNQVLRGLRQAAGSDDFAVVDGKVYPAEVIQSREEKPKRYRVSLCRKCSHPGGQHILDGGCRLCAECDGWEDGGKGWWTHGDTIREANAYEGRKRAAGLDA